MPGSRKAATAAKSDGPFPTLDDLEREHVKRALEVTKGNKSQAARLLGIDRVTLYARLKRHGIST